jgi:hypothetical protein
MTLPTTAPPPVGHHGSTAVEHGPSAHPMKEEAEDEDPGAPGL